ncbi:FUSC family protein [Blastococcus sp. CCUG 61487]|uniref:FUSC family protein n=1 Tax=Blastococcus sp. CCUG 61487 TaxID=1840703 RepID=UPI0014853481|nr:FUSC family protein [Blastococcus sp. CCUG 61487]
MRDLLRPLRQAGRSAFGPSLPTLWQSGGRRGLTAAVCAVVPLSVGVAFDEPGLGAAGALTAFSAIYGHALPYPRRAVVVAGVASGLAIAGWLGALTGQHPVALSLLVGVLAAVGTVATAVWRIGPPGAVGFVIVAGGSSALGTSPTEHLLVGVAAAALAWIGCMLPWLWDPTGPERRAVENAERTVAAMAGSGEGRPSPAGVWDVVRAADTALAQSDRAGRDDLRVRQRSTEACFLRALPRTGRPAPVHAAAATPAGPATRPPWVETALRTGLAVALAGLAAALLDLANTYWAATTAAAVLASTDPRHTRIRALERGLGTLLGVLIAGAIITADLPVAVQIALVGVLQLTIELFVAHRYWLAVSFITPLVLTLVHMAVPERSSDELVLERLTETALGIVVALVIGLSVFRRSASRRLPGAVAAARQATVRAARQPSGHASDVRLHDALVALDQIAAAARAEPLPRAEVAADLERAEHVADLGWALLGAQGREEEEIEAALRRRITDELVPGGR